MVDVWGDVLRPPHGTTPAAVKSNKNQNFDLHKDFDGTFAMTFIDAPKTHSRTDDISCENEDVGFSDAESEVVDNNMLKRFPTVKKKKKRTEYNNVYKKKQRKILHLKQQRKDIKTSV